MATPEDEIFRGTPELTDDMRQQMMDEEAVMDETEHILDQAVDTGQPSPGQPAQQTQQQQPDNSSKEDKDKKEQSLMEYALDPKRVTDKAENLLAIPTGVADWGIGLLNKLPTKRDHKAFPNFVNEDGKLKSIPRYQSETANAVRDIASVVVPTLWLTSKFKFLGAAAHKKVGWKIGNDAFVKYMSTAGLAAGAGAIVDEIAPVQEKDHNAAGMLRKTFPQTWGWISEDVATLDSDSPDVKRAKNRNEGIAVGLGSDVLIGVAKLTKAVRGVQHATSWVPETEKARPFVDKMKKRQKLSADPVENEVLNSAKRRSDELDELGAQNLAEAEGDLSKPVFGVHDAFDPVESGIRSSDPGGITAAGVDAVRISKQIDTAHGRLGSVMTESAIKGGLKANDAGQALIRKLAKELRENEVTWTNGKKKVTHADVMKQADVLAADLLDMDVDQLRKVFEPRMGVDVSTGARELDDVGAATAMKGIKDYMNLYTNLDLTRASGITSTSLAGQVSDMAEGMRLMDGSAAVERAQEQILDRLQYLMQIKGQTSYARGRALQMLNLWNRVQRGIKSPEQIIKQEKNNTIKALERIRNESQQTVDTLRAVKEQRPQMLGPLMLAYEVTDGKVSTISKLNEYVRNSTGVVSKAFFDARSDMPSAWTQGMWANIYNSVLSAVGTPLKAGLSNTVLMIERPLATFAGAVINRDWKTLRKAHYMYNIAIADTAQKSWSHMNQVFKRASRDPNSVGYIMRDDIARKNEDQITLLRSFADAKETEGLYGPSVMVDQIEAMNDLAEHPALRFSANLMTAFDGYTRAFVGNVESRGRAYDALMNAGEPINPGKLKEISNKVYKEMFDENGFITDTAVEYASREIAMNLNSSVVDGVNSFILNVPAVKPFLMFPKTSMNMLQFTLSHSPTGMIPGGSLIPFVKDWHAFNTPFKEQNWEKVQELLTSRGVEFDFDTAETVYDTIRAELKGRKAIGTLSVSAAVGLFLQDRIRGNGHYDKQRQKVRRELGWRPRTYKGLDGNWYSYENLGAISDWLSATVDIMDNFETLDENDIATQLNKVGFLLGANLTNKSFIAGLEPMGDVFQGRPDAIARWGASFGSSFVPGSGLRNEFARLMTPQLKEHDQDFQQLLANRNPFAKDALPDLYDWIDGSVVGEPMGIFARFWNVYSPLWKVSESISPEKQFLIDMEFDARPSLTTNGKGVEYSPDERSAVTQIMGERGYFRNELREIMNRTDVKQFYKELQKARAKGVYFDRTVWGDIHKDIERALRNAQRFAEDQIPQAADVDRKQWINNENVRDARRRDLDRILELQRLTN